MKFTRVGAAVATTAIAAFALTACSGGGTAEQPTSTMTSAGLSGTLNATGASSQEKAELNVWIPGFTGVETGVTINYTATGSGTGRENFVAGQSDFIGSDRAFKSDEISSSTFKMCAEGADIVEIPAYISPIAIAFNLPTVDALNLDASVLAGIFSGSITNWNDAKIAALNEGAELPDLKITPVHRGDKSGTTGNFLAYLEKTAPSDWTLGHDDTFPEDQLSGSAKGESADKTAGVAAAVSAGEGTIGYLDASAAKDLQTAAIKSGSDFVEYTPEAAAAVVAGSPVADGRAATDVAVDLDYAGVDGSYPIVLVSYLIGCQEYADATKGALVKSYFNYVISSQAQSAAADEVGNAPISDELRAKAQAAVDAMK